MIITKITRSYSRSINAISYGAKSDSWIKITSEQEAILESGDEASKVSEYLDKQCVSDVVRSINVVIDSIKGPVITTPTIIQTLPNKPRQL